MQFYTDTDFKFSSWCNVNTDLVLWFLHYVEVGCVANILEESGVSNFKVKISIITSIQTGGLFQNFKYDKMDSFLTSCFLILFNHIHVLNATCNMTTCRKRYLNG